MNKKLLIILAIAVTLTLALGVGIAGGIAFADNYTIASMDATGGERLSFVNDASKPWSVAMDGGVLTASSGNKGVNSSTSTLTVTCLVAGTFSFEYEGSSENNYDWFAIKKNGATPCLAYNSGKQNNGLSGLNYSGIWTKLSVSVVANDYITFAFSKDSGAAGGSDTWRIRNLSLIALDDKVNATVVAGANGTVAVSGYSEGTCSTIENGFSINQTSMLNGFTMSASANENYVFAGWKVAGASECFSYNNPLSVQPLVETNYVAEFCAPLSLTVQVNNAAYGVITGEGANYQPNQSVTLTASPNDGYLFFAWKDASDNILSNSSTYVANLGSSSLTLKAEFQEGFLGAGTVAEPYLVDSLNKLQLLQVLVSQNIGTFSSASYKQTVDIDLASVANFAGIGSSTVHFKGNYDGDNHVIKNLKMNYVGTDYAGFFMYVEAPSTVESHTFKNIIFENPDLKAGGSYSYLGTLIAYSMYDLIVDNVKVINANILSTGSGYNQGIGGIVGTLNQYQVGGTTISNCSFSGTATGEKNVGGILGYASTWTSSSKIDILNCTNYGTLTSLYPYSSSYAAGICGYVSGSSSISNITNCINVGEVNAVANAGAIVSYSDVKTISYSFCYNAGSVKNGTVASNDTIIGKQNKACVVNACGKVTPENGIYTFTYSDGSVMSSVVAPTVSLSGSSVLSSDVSSVSATTTAAIYLLTNKTNSAVFTIASTEATSLNGLTPVVENGASTFTVSLSEYGFSQFSFRIVNAGALDTYINLKISNPGISENITEGYGTAANPYLLDSQEAFYDISLNNTACYALKQNVEFVSSYATPSYEFKGVFDGGNYRISGLTLTATDGNIALFGTTIGATIKNLVIDGVIIDGSGTRVSVIVSTANGGSSFDNIKIYNADITIDSSERAGGIVSYTESAISIKNCYIDGEISVTSTGYFGGILGYCHCSDVDVIIRNNINAANITSQDSTVGGIIGRVYAANANSVIDHCLNMGKIQAAIGGAILGEHSSSNALPTDCYNIATVNDSFAILMGVASNYSTMALNRYVGDSRDETGVSLFPIVKESFGIDVAPISGMDIYANGALAVGDVLSANYLYVNIGKASSFSVDMKLQNGQEVYYKGVKRTGVFTLDAPNAVGKTYYDFTAKKAGCVDNKFTLIVQNEGIFGSTISKGYGTEALPYQIATIQNLQDMQKDVTACYKLMNNIDAEGFEFTPIAQNGASFSGVLDGNGYSVANISRSTDMAYYNYGESYISAFIGFFSGTMKNIVFNNIYLSSGYQYGTCSALIIGNVVARPSGSILFDNVKVVNSKMLEETSTSGKNSMFINEIENASVVIKNCSVAGEMDGGLSGGFVYATSAATVTFENCVNYAYVMNYNQVGGFVSQALRNSELTFTNCANLGRVRSNKKGTDGSSAFVMRAYAANIIYNDCYNLAPVLKGNGTIIENSKLLFLAMIENGTTVTRNGCYTLYPNESLSEANVETVSEVSSEALVGTLRGVIFPQVPTLSSIARTNEDEVDFEQSVIENVCYNLYKLSVDNKSLFEANGTSKNGLKFTFQDASSITLYQNGVAIAPVGNDITLASFVNTDSLFFVVKAAELGKESYIAVTFHSTQSGLEGAEYISEGRGTSADPYIISSVNALYEARNYPTYSYKIVVKAPDGITDITSETVWELGDSWENAPAWTVFGTESVPYKGVFDGNGITIKKVKLDNAAASNVGFFGTVDKATIKNLNLDVNFRGLNKIGGLIGSCKNSIEVSNCTVSGTVYGSSEWVAGIAGFVGGTGAIRVIGCTIDADVSGKRCVGGVLNGYYTTNSVIDTFVNGTVSLIGGEEGNYPYWGIVSGYGAWVDVDMTNSGQKVVIYLPTATDVADIKLYNSNKAIYGMTPTSVETIGDVKKYTFNAVYDDVCVGTTVDLNDVDKLTSEVRENGILGNYAGFTVRVTDSNGYYKYIATLDRENAQFKSVFGSESEPYNIGALNSYEDNFSDLLVDVTKAEPFDYIKPNGVQVKSYTFATVSIGNANDFEHLSKIIAGGIPTDIGGYHFTMRTVATLCIKLTNDIDLTDLRLSSLGTVLAQKGTKQFYGFGVSEFSPYRGSIYGGSKTLTVDMSFANAYAMGVIAIGSEYLRTQVVENLTVHGAITANCKAGIIGLFDNYEPQMAGRDASIKLTNVNNYANVSGGRMIGGLIGYVNNGEQVDIISCNNYGRITCTGSTGYGIGGLVGDLLTCSPSTCTIDSSSNFGVIWGKGNNSGVGGLIGRVGQAVIFKGNNLNYASVFVKAQAYTGSAIGGIIGYAANPSDAITSGIVLRSGARLINLGLIQGGSDVGGIVGTLKAKASFVLDRISQYADVTSATNKSGTLFGSTNVDVSVSNATIESKANGLNRYTSSGTVNIID